MKEIIERLSVKPFSIVGHRGAAKEKPENTLSAFDYAIKLGVEVVECDVRKTKDGKLIISHDENLKRTTGVDVKISELSFEEIRKLKVQTEPIPTLEEVIDLVQDKCGLFIEIKEPATTEKVIETVKKIAKNTDWLAIISFYEDALKTVKEIAPEITTGLIYFKPPGKIFEAKGLKCELVLPNWKLSTEKAVRFAHKLKLKVISWTVDDEKSLSKCLKAKTDSIATDIPSWLIKEREKLIYNYQKQNGEQNEGSDSR